MQNKPLFIALSFSFLSLPALADQVNFKNGDRLSGTIISTRDVNTLYFQSAYGGDMRINWDQIESVFDQNMRPVVKPVAPSSVSTLTGYNDARVETWTQNQIVTTSPQSAPSAPENLAENEDNFKWSGRVNFGGALEEGNSKSKSLGLDANLTARDAKNRFHFGGEANWEEESGQETENDPLGFGLYDRCVTEEYFVGGNLQFERDKFEELDLRSRIGLYNGYQFYEQDDLNLQIKAGAEYIDEQFTDDSSENDIAASWGFDYDQKFYEGAFQLFHAHNISVPVSNTVAFLIDSETGIRVPVGKHLTGTAQVDYDWDNEPAAGVQEDDTSYSIKLGYEW